MTGDDQIASIADSSKPNAGRIYDFALGGHHNFDVDRQAAQGIFQLFPGFQKSARTIRWFLGEAVRRLVADGFTQFIDFASGLPTVDHVHEIAPKGTKVVYSDVDPVTVAYGQEIVRNNPDVRYVVCNVATPEHMFQDPAISQFLERGRRTGIGMNGVAYFLKDEDIAHSMRVLYDWAAKGTRLYISDADNDPSNAPATMQEMSATYKKIGQPMFTRSLKTLLELCKPWKVVDPGFRRLEEWVNLKVGVGEAEELMMGGPIFGGILEK